MKAFYKNAAVLVALACNTDIAVDIKLSYHHFVTVRFSVRIQLLFDYFVVVFTATLDIIFNWKARRTTEFAVKLRYVLKFTLAALWVVLLPVTYAYTWENPTGVVRAIKNWFGNGRDHPSLFVISVVIYMSPSMLAAILFLLPFIRRKLESSDVWPVRLTMWWSQVNLKLLYITWLIP
jgi:hypothetical protein